MNKESPKKNKTYYIEIFFKNILTNKIGSIVLLGVIVILLFKFMLVPFYTKYNQEHTTIVSESSLEKIIKLSEISTYQTVYNGVAEVYASSEAEQKNDPLYLVSYESTIKAGIDMNDILVDVNKKNKKIIFTIPKIKLTNVSVKMETLKIMFRNTDANTETVSKDAYQSAYNDATKECENNSALNELATSNLKNAITGLIKPLLNQENEEYEICFLEGDKQYEEE